MAKNEPGKLVQEIVALGELAAIPQEKLAERAKVNIKRLNGEKKFRKKDCRKISAVLQIPKPIVKLMTLPATEYSKTEGSILLATQEYVRKIVEARTEKKLKKKKEQAS